MKTADMEVDTWVKKAYARLIARSVNIHFADTELEEQISAQSPQAKSQAPVVEETIRPRRGTRLERSDRGGSYQQPVVSIPSVQGAVPVVHHRRAG